MADSPRGRGSSWSDRIVRAAGGIEPRDTPSTSLSRRRKSLRKARILAVAIIAAFGLTAVAAYAANVCTGSGPVSPTGGTKKKPKPVGLSFGYTTDDDSGVNLAAPVKSYDIFFEGITLNSKVVKKKC